MWYYSLRTGFPIIWYDMEESFTSESCFNLLHSPCILQMCQEIRIVFFWGFLYKEGFSNALLPTKGIKNTEVHVVSIWTRSHWICISWSARLYLAGVYETTTNSLFLRNKYCDWLHWLQRLKRGHVHRKNSKWKCRNLYLL